MIAIAVRPVWSPWPAGPVAALHTCGGATAGGRRVRRPVPPVPGHQHERLDAYLSQLTRPETVEVSDDRDGW